ADERRPVERDEVGAERVDQVAPGVLGRHDEDASRRLWELRDEPFLARVAGDERGVDAVHPEGLRGSRPDRGDARKLARTPPGEVVGPVRARYDDPVVR